MTNQDRPKVVTVIAWICIMMGVLAILLLPTREGQKYIRKLAHTSEVLQAVVMLYIVIRSGLSIIAGVGLLDGKTWGRILFLAVWGVNLVVSLLSSDYSAGFVFQLLFYCTLAYLLFSEYTRGYFSKNSEQEPNKVNE